MRTALRRVRHRLTDVVAWTPPTSTEIGTVAKSGLAAGLAWWIAGAVTDVPSPVLAPLTALVVVQVSVRASIRLSGTAHPAMPAMGVLLTALAQAIRALERDVVAGGASSDLGSALDEVHVRRQRCVQGAARRARLALEREAEPDIEGLEGEWLNYAAVLVQVDRIVADLRDPLLT